jgi:phospholipase/carboxylesterase
MHTINHTTIEVEPTRSADKSIIWLHGLGADGSDFVSLIPELRLPSDMNIRFIFPHAPIQPITLNRGHKMRAWFDITALSADAKIDEAGIATSRVAIAQLIEQEESRGIRSDHIMLAGFSQGAVMALATGLHYTKPLAGILALSGYLPIASQILQAAHSANKHIPIFVAHGTKDTIVSYSLGKHAYVTLKQAGYVASWHSYDMAHSICTAEIHDISQWIQHCYVQSMANPQ